MKIYPSETSQTPLLVAVAGYPTPDGGKALAYVHTRNLYYRNKGLNVTVLNFGAHSDYDIDGIRVITLETFRKSSLSYRILILHAANLRNHYIFLKRYGNRFGHFVFFFHGHEVLKINSVYSEAYDFVKKRKAPYFQDIYDTLKLQVWRNFLPKIREKSYFIFVSRWMYDQFLLNTGIDQSMLENRCSIIYNSVGETFSANAWDETSPKEFDFITIRSIVIQLKKRLQ